MRRWVRVRGTARVVMSDVEALAAACAGGHVEKVESLLAKGTCVVTRVQWAFSLGSARIDFPARAGRIPRGSLSFFKPARGRRRASRRFALRDHPRAWRNYHLTITCFVLIANLTTPPRSRAGADANKEDVVFGTPLVAASRGGHSACVLLLLAKGADCDRRSQRDTPLTAAVTSGHLNVAKLLLESGRCDSSTPQGEDTAETNLVVTPGVSADLAEEKERVSKNTKKSNSHRRRDERTHQKPTQTDDPLTLAAKNGDLALVDLLLQHGASPDGGGREGTCDTPLVAAAAGGFEQIVTRLCDAGAKVDGVAKYAGRTALVAAAESEAIGASQCCIKLLEKGADANFVSAGVVGRRLGYGAVHAAAARMDCDLVRALVAAGADPNRRARNTDVENVRSRRAAAARALWGVEGAVERLDNTPLHLAVAAYINEAAKRRVLENQRKAELEEADDDTKNSSVVVAGDRVTQDSETNATKAKRDADTNSTSDSAGSGVSGGVPGEGERSALAVVKTLLECGADHGAFVVDSTPLHMAALGGATDVVDVLMEAGADANARAPNGYTTPLEAAARYAADILLDRRDEKVSSRYRRHRVSDRYARSADDSDTDSRVDELLAARGEYDDDDLSFDDDPRYDDPYGDDGGWYDDDQGSRGEFGRSNRRRDVLFASKMKKSGADRGDLVRDDDDDDDSYDSRESDDDDDSFYGGGDDDAAMAALRDAEGPLRAARHLVTKWHAQVTPHALVGACRAGDELTAFALLDACKKAWDEKKTDLSPEALVKSVARNTTALHAAAESGCVAIARALIEKGSPVDFRRPDDDATPLFVAARGGRPGMIAFLFSQGADIEALCKTADRREGHDTVTPLVEAVMSDQAAAAARLIALGADVKAPNSWMPPLLTATLRSNATITRMLLKEGADPRVGVGGMTPLGLAVMTRQSDLVHALLDWRGDDDGDSTGDDESQSKKPRKAMSTESDDDLFDSPLSMLDAGVAEPGEDPLVIAAARARAREARDAKGKKARKKNKNSPSKFVRVDPDEPIDAAVLDDGDPEMSSACQCPVCQRRGRDGEGRDPAQCTPVDRNANASNNSNPSNSTGGASYGAERHLTPLAAAAKLDDAETVRALLAAGANPERASGGMPPLAHAAGKGSCAAIIALLDGGALLESPASLPLTPRDGRTLTPLGVASEAGELSAVELLLERGADPNGPPNDGFEPPLCCAVTDPPDDEFGNPVVGVVRALIAAGADPNASKEDAQSPYSPLMVAAGAGSVAVVKELLDGGADLEHVVRVTVGDSGGPRGGPDRKCHITALLHAAYCNELDAVRFLLLQGAKLGSADREAMSLVCDHLRSKASVGVPDASATLSLLRHQADAEADEEDEKAEQRLREERARAAELKEERKRARKQDAANAEQDAIKKAEEELLGKAEEEKAEAERLAAKVRKQEEYKKEQELRKREAAAKRAEVKAEKDTKKAAAEAEAAAEKAEQQKVLDEVQKMVADLEIKRKADEAEKELKARREREKVIKEELRLEKAEAEKEALEVAKKQKELAKELKKKESAAAQGAAKGSSETTTVAATAAASVSTGGGLQKPSKAAAVSAAALSAAAAKAHLLARDTAEGFTGPATKVNKDDAAEAASWAQPGGFFVFLCNDSTEEECYERGLMGAPAKFWDNTVDHVKAGTTLVLYNFAARTLTGKYFPLTTFRRLIAHTRTRRDYYLCPLP